jgi:catechol 2,3-dioxygenase-like lactoylglutathione lyase family enzyme
MVGSEETNETSPRRNVGAIDHLVLAYADVRRQAEAKEEFSAVLGMDDWDDLGELDEAGVRVFVSWSSGLELLAPTGSDSIIARHLAERGEGLFSVVVGVADLDAAVEVVRGSGGKAVYFPPPPAKIAARFAIAREALVVGKVGGLALVLGEFAPRAERA